MNNNLIKIEDENGMFRDKTTNAIVFSRTSELDSSAKRSVFLQNQQKDINNLKKEVSEIKENLSKILDILTKKD